MSIDHVNWKTNYNDFVLNGETEMARLLKNAYFPTRLFKFREFDKNNYWKSWVHGNIYLSNPANFNDPFDCSLSLSLNDYNEIVRNYLYEAIQDVGIPISGYEQNEVNNSSNPVDALCNILRQHGYVIGQDRFKKINRQRYSKALQDQIRIICFGEELNSIVMWAHYAAMHSGFCIEYNFSGQEHFKDFVFPVVYGRARYRLSAKIFDSATTWMLPSIVCKSEEWCYENEWRFFTSEKTTTEESDSIDCSEALVAIYAGAKISEKNSELLDKEAKAGIPVYDMHMSYDEYALHAHARPHQPKL